MSGNVVALVFLSFFIYSTSFAVTSSDDVTSSKKTSPSNIVNTLSDEEQKFLAKKGHLTTCVDPDWMPLEKLDNGQYTGMGSDYLQLFSEKLNTPINVVKTKTWAESKAHAKARICDMLMLSSDSNKRRQYMNISEPYLRLPIVIAGRSDELFVPNLSHLNGKNIGIIDSYALKELLIQQYPEINFIGVSSRDSGLQQVVNGDLFGYIDTVTAIGYSVQKDYYGELKIIAKLSIDWDLSVATRNDQPLLNDIFNKAIQHISGEEHSIIFNRWVAISYQKGTDNRIVWNTIAVFSVLFLFLLYRDRQRSKHRKSVQVTNEQLITLNRELKLKQNEISHMAFHDGLTGLPNKKYLSDELTRAINLANRTNSKLAILFIDLDRFKIINDTLGHSIGDRFLKAMGSNLQSALRRVDILARVGGDEFVVLIQNMQNASEPTLVANKLLTAAAEKITVDNYELECTASIGIAVYPDDGVEKDSLMKNADSAMYAAKDAGKNNYHFYTAQLLDNILRRVFIEKAIRVALEEDQFSLVYQPKINLSDNTLNSAEVLIRWVHPDEGFISPAEFIPIAEDGGLVVAIGEWVFDKACAQLKEWHTQGIAIDCLAINVSSVQFSRTEVVSVFNKIIDWHGLKAENIEIEITEHSMMENTDKNIAILSELRNSGFKVAIDDFGTGYSSMSYLRSMPVNTIKIDKSFVDDLPDDEGAAQISNAIIALAHTLKFDVVAEGIETEEQLMFLKEQGCDIAQGYYCSRPLIAEDLVQFIEDMQN